ncbi:hypothetical protein C8R47DRAFT_1166743 [Mycena vitilis]|nr:hypothetical protein C8R47DRAFT_1166743 [Mycena vitilis]
MDGGPRFPPDLEREVFETMALMYPQKIPTLLRVARRVLVWIEPLLYRAVRISGHDEATERPLLNAMASRSPAFFHAVRHVILLGLSDNFPEKDALRLLKLCTGLTSFGCNYAWTDRSILPILGEKRIRRLSITLSELFGAAEADLGHPLFHSVTHLDLLGREGIEQVIGDVRKLPALTHLCLDWEVPEELVASALADCPSLTLLLVQAYHGAEPFDYQIRDVRFVVGISGDYWVDWEACASHATQLTDFWSEAEDFVERRRNGEIEATRYWLKEL